MYYKIVNRGIQINPGTTVKSVGFSTEIAINLAYQLLKNIQVEELIVPPRLTISPQQAL